jgi:hypothetical protein
VAASDVVKLAVFDSRDRTFVASADVNEPGYAGDADRVNLAVDALDRVTVSWVSQPQGYGQRQVAARVFAFDPTAKKISPLAASFLAFINVNPTNNIRSIQMSPAMTTRQICIAAKGEINLRNKPEQGTNSPTQINFYTVISHPAPVADPTTPVGGQAPALSIQRSGTELTISWAPATAGFTLQETTSLPASSWSPGPTGNPVNVPITGNAKYYRLIKP